MRLQLSFKWWFFFNQGCYHALDTSTHFCYRFILLSTLFKWKTHLISGTFCSTEVPTCSFLASVVVPETDSKPKLKWWDSEDISKSGRESEEFKRFDHLEEFSNASQDRNFIPLPSLCDSVSAFLLHQKCLWRIGLLLFGSTWRKGPPEICSGPSGKWLTVLGWKIGKDFAEGHWDVKSVQTQKVSLSLILKPCQASLESKTLWTTLNILNYEGASNGIFWVCVGKS